MTLFTALLLVLSLISGGTIGIYGAENGWPLLRVLTVACLVSLFSSFLFTAATHLVS